jgi:phospholipid transport system transporter-binding protein
MLMLPGTLTNREASDTLRMLSQALQHEPGTDVVVNAGGLQHLDSAALAVLLECERLAQAWGKTFSIRQAPAKLVALATLYGVDELLLRNAEAAPTAT